MSCQRRVVTEITIDKLMWLYGLLQGDAFEDGSTLSPEKYIACNVFLAKAQVTPGKECFL